MIDGKMIMDIEAEKAIQANATGDTTLATAVAALSAKVPNATLPTSAGNYMLKVEVSGSTVTYSWVVVE